MRSLVAATSMRFIAKASRACDRASSVRGPQSSRTLPRYARAPSTVAFGFVTASDTMLWTWTGCRGAAVGAAPANRVERGAGASATPSRPAAAAGWPLHLRACWTAAGACVNVRSQPAGHGYRPDASRGPRLI